MYDIYIYDIEVFANDWIVVLREIKSTDHVIIWNDNLKLKRFIMDHRNDLLIGFNNKHYDDWIMTSILSGANNEIIKRHNDFIISGGNGWEYPFIQGQGKLFKSGDLRDDLPIGLSLKAIEANIYANIKESNVDFNINRPLTKMELMQTIEYCKTDVDNTLKLYHTRKSYLDSKRMIAKLKGIDERDALALTNAKLTAVFLDAKKKKYNDEMEYTPPECLRLGKYQYVLDFFNNPVEYTIKLLEEEKKICTRKIRIKSIDNKIERLRSTNNRYDCKLETDINGISHVYGWGGIHGAKKNYFMKADDTHIIETIDVGSYYPSMMLVYNYISRSIPSADGYRNVYNTRMSAKHNGQKEVADALKLILNTCYGAMKNQYNPLYDPKNASAICITGMLLLTDLIDKLESVPSFELIQSNTDGIIIRYAISDQKKIHAIVSEWEARTGMTMEYTQMQAIAQKDVNNYVMSAGITYMIKDSEKVVTGDAKGKLKTKGGYVSLQAGGDYKNNTMAIIHRAVTNYLMNDIPAEKTILECNDINQFQIISKTGSSYDETIWINDGKEIQVQRVNRVYASLDQKHGTLYKRKNGKLSNLSVEDASAERTDKVANLPDHCIIDNECKLTIDKIDKQFYIDLANKRILDYIGKSTKEIKTMANDKMSLYQKVLKIRQDFIKSNIKKSGLNRFAGFKYFELSDIVPVALDLCNKYGVLPMISFESDTAVMRVVDVDSDNVITFRSPMIELDKRPQGANSIQSLGAIETYQRRYLYMLFLDIVESDTFDAVSSDVKTSTKKESTNDKTEVKETNVNDPADEITINNIKRGLKKLRESGGDHEAFITDVIGRIKKGVTEFEAQELLTITAEKLKGL